MTPANFTLAGSQVYNAGTAFAGSHLTATGVASQTFTVTGSGDNSNLTSANVQTGSTLNSVTGLVLGSSSNGGIATNYTALSTTGSSVNVTKAPLTITGQNNTPLYNGASQTNTGASVTGQVGGQGIAVNGGYAVATNVSDGKVNDAGYTLSYSNGAVAGNYDVTSTSYGSLTITPANLTLAGSQVYNAGTAFAGSHLTATGVASQTFTVTGSGDNSNLASANVQTGSTLNSVTGLVLGSSSNGGIATNYTAISTTGSTVNVTPAPLKVVGATTITTYNGTAQTNTLLPPVGLLDSDTVTGVSGLATRTLVGTSVDSLSAATGTGLSNYTITYVNGSLQITPAALPPSLPAIISNRYIDSMTYLQSLFFLNNVDLETGVECNKSTTYTTSAKKCTTSNAGSVLRVIDGGINSNFIGASLNDD